MQTFVKTDFEPDFYRRLGLAHNATKAEIASAYRKLAKRTHPDLNPGDRDAAKRFVAISRAHEYLSDPDKRKAYDAELKTQQPVADFVRGSYARSDSIMLKKPANEQNIRPRARRSWHETGILTPVFKWPEYADNDMARYYVSLAHLEKGTATTNDLDFLGRYTGKSLGAQPGNKDQQRQFRRALPQSLFEYNGPAF